MCPLRFILVFLSATLAGFFVLRNFRSQPHVTNTELDANNENNEHTLTLKNATSKVRDVLQSGFWTFLDMASGRYLWRHLVSSSSPNPE
ncbi:uncharacterized protein HKW66_Vig0128000 [Vigna angularis]|uniref:Methyltransferase n=2 Tax=Phaseolus angularis TaxID=3914 RepID=A0A8T0K412_PHAAN|nr:uncharacterized protein LOC128197675 [Vigna angularis]KAG2391439.1 uncharacterized protein HKW66_Vig0128000 [Vigna angularis]BAT81382.1 hypothetical protein VIGAN_03109200 [Vigna angularis var. angularis]